MYGEYGYMEEGELGRPYNLSLLKRLAKHAFPYKKRILLGLSLSLFITIFDLASPYLAKIAIDRYIISSWYMVQPDKGGEGLTVEKYDDLLIKAESVDFISHEDMRKIDPAELSRFKSRGIIGSERFYRAGPDAFYSGIGPDKRDKCRKMHDGSFLIPFELMDGLERDKVLDIRGGDVRGVSFVAFIFFSFIFFSFAFGYAEHYTLEFIGQRVMHDIRLKLFDRILSQSLSFFNRHPVGRLVTRVTNDVENLNEMFKSVLITLFKDFFLLLGILSVLFYLNIGLALICMALVPFIFALTLLFSRLAREAFRELRTTVAKINSFIQERIKGMRVIQLFAQEESQYAAFRSISRENYLAGMKQIRVFAVFMPLMELFSSFAVALIIWKGGGRVVSEQITLGTLVAFISYIQMFFKPIRDISEKYNIMQSAMASTERIFEFMDHREEIPEPVNPVMPGKSEGHVIFDRVSFSYEKGRKVIDDVSFEVKPGETVAIVGATGSGKTTLISLLERFHDPDQGRISLDRVDLRMWPKEKLRDSISLVLQDVFIFAGSLQDNILLGRSGIDRGALQRAVVKANAAGFIKRLPQGLGHEVGEEGASISAGQRQLLSFARALAGDPGVLILDEATSSVDPETERLIQEAVNHMTRSRTTIIVAHRMATIRKADRIFVMDRGRIMESGNHEELMQRAGLYARFNRLGRLNVAGLKATSGNDPFPDVH